MPENPLEKYLSDLSAIRSTGSSVPETSYYGALAALLDAVGATLKPKVRCIVNPSHGSGIPDIGLFTPDQFQRASAAEPPAREHDVLGRGLTTDEVKTATEIARRIAAILLMEPELDANYESVKKSAYDWTSSRPENKADPRVAK